MTELCVPKTRYFLCNSYLPISKSPLKIEKIFTEFFESTRFEGLASAGERRHALVARPGEAEYESGVSEEASAVVAVEFGVVRVQEQAGQRHLTGRGCSYGQRRRQEFG